MFELHETLACAYRSVLNTAETRKDAGSNSGTYIHRQFVSNRQLVIVGSMQSNLSSTFGLCLTLIGHVLAIYNPIISGWNPDPSILRVGDKYHIATSSFEYFPGIPVYQSMPALDKKFVGAVSRRRAKRLTTMQVPICRIGPLCRTLSQGPISCSYMALRREQVRDLSLAHGSSEELFLTMHRCLGPFPVTLRWPFLACCYDSMDI